MIRFHYSYPSFKIKSPALIKSWLMLVAKSEKKKIECLDYIFVTDEALRGINQQSLQHDEYTDILTYPYSYDPIEGEIYISIDRIKEHAITYHVRLDQELRRVMVHGLLHLCGYGDTTKIKKKEMTSKEDKYLVLFI